MTWAATAAAVAAAAYSAHASGEAEDEAEARARGRGAEERDRQKRIDARIGVVNRLFDSPERQRQYGDFQNALREYLGDELARKKTDASRERKFAIARSGLYGGSADRDTRAELGDEFERAALEAEQEARQRTFDLQGADEQARLNLIGLVRSGLDATTAQQRGTARQQSNLAQAMAGTETDALGDIFSNTFETTREISERQERRRGFGYAANRADLYGGRV